MASFIAFKEASLRTFKLSLTMRHLKSIYYKYKFKAMTISLELFLWVVGGLIAASGGLLTIIWKYTNNRIDQNEKRIESLEQETAKELRVLRDEQIQGFKEVTNAINNLTINILKEEISELKEKKIT